MCDGRPVVLHGPNGAGKTNVLEALSLLAPGRGLRRAVATDWPKRGRSAQHWSIAARLQRPDGEMALGTGREDGQERRLVRIDGRAARNQAELGDILGVIWLTPAMDRLFVEGAAGRRQFLDRMAVNLHPGHTAHATAYERAQRERMRLLRDGPADPGWLAVLEQTMAEAGTAVTATRWATVTALNEACQQGESAFPAARLELVGGLDEKLASQGPDAAQAWFRRSLETERRRDGEAGQTATGPQRTDVVVRHGGHGGFAAQGSTGEQKALLLAMILGLARCRAAQTGVAPLLLLDEVAAHLDRARRAALFDEICRLSGQCWMSGTEAALFADLGERGQYLHLVDHAVVTG